ncbi:MAG: phenylacetate--CoA ligase family protein [Lentisphaerae bacterium]|nr:phenylacetate--CoA ligase family protein [Lentisphaerota bacterium]
MNSLYGQVRGYDRLRIRREAARNAGISRAELRDVCDSLLAKRLATSIRHFAGYADKVSRHLGGVPGTGVPVRLADLPVWTRDDQNRLFDSLEGPPAEGSYVHSTGGSTGSPTRFYVTRESYEWRTAVSDRAYSWAGAEEGQRSVYVWGTPVYPPALTARLKSRTHHWLQRRAYFDSFRFGEKEKEDCCALINRVRPHSLVGYAGNLVELADFVRRQPASLTWKAPTAVTAAEGLAPGRRELLEEHLAAEVFMSYGSREFMLIGMECREHSGYHVATDNVMAEVVAEDGTPASPGETGRILVTDLRNDGNPFLRYEIGDLGAMMPEDGVCPCGLPFPLLARVDGRTQEVIRLPGGEKLTALFVPHLMKEFGWIRGYQLVQESDRAIRIRLVGDKELTPELTGPVADALRPKVGSEMRIEFELVDCLDKTPSGKTPIVIQGERRR